MERPRSKTRLYFAPGSRVDIRQSSDLRQALAALRTTGSENLTPSLRGLARTISDFPFPLDLGRLPCHLHDFCFLSTLNFRVLYQNVRRLIKGATTRTRFIACHNQKLICGTNTDLAAATRPHLQPSTSKLQALLGDDFAEKFDDFDLMQLAHVRSRRPDGTSRRRRIRCTCRRRRAGRR